MAIATFLFLTSTAQAYTAAHFVDRLDLDTRLEDGSIHADIRRSQGEEALMEQQDHGNYESFRRHFERRVSANMSAVRQVVRCAADPENCVSSRERDR